MSHPNNRLYGPNRFKLGLFGLNCSGGLTMTKAPEYWDASFENNLTAARLADEAGLEFLLPIGRWHGYGGETDTASESFETLTWASGLLAATSRISIFGTVHVSLLSPIFAAKQMVTAHHIGQGRFGLNIVSGWNVGEHEMHGVKIREHDERYDYSEEWVTIVKRIWLEDEPFDFKGKYFDLKGVQLKPKPWGDDRPLLISAGNSSAGLAFAGRHADCLFTSVRELDELSGKIGELQSVRPADSAGIYASGHLICKPTRKEADEYYHYIVYEMGDWEAAEHTVKIRTRGGSTSGEKLDQMKEVIISGTGTHCVRGSYDDVAEHFKFLSECGLDGIALGLVNYIGDFPPLRDEVIPRLQRLGLRV
ncbi:LLM class flavin-dependent oxidoreductase [Alphaproteobacteria bacterium]|nr:LLM class flavin-dependent oxidoreductase [Alphaproteobacteria bacterium]